MIETVIVTGSDLAVEQRSDGGGVTRCTVPTTPVNPKRKRPEEYVAPPPSDVDLVKLHESMAIDNPYWSDEANDWADAHPEVRPKDAAKKWRKHRIEPEAA